MQINVYIYNCYYYTEPIIIHISAMKKHVLCILAAAFMCSGTFAYADEYHVAKTGSDKNPGTAESPFLTISKAASTAKTGDVVTVHEGVYREWVNPLNSGATARNRIVYQAAAGEEVWIKGSEEIDNWKREGKTNVWKVTIPNTFFGGFNPFAVILEGDWLNTTEPYFCLGEVYLNNKSLYQAENVEAVKDASEHLRWCVDVDDVQTTIWANFGGADPNKELAEINVRPAVFYPVQPGVNFITVRGFHLSQAATQWAPPTAYQEGLIGPHWSKGWIIEDNWISNSKCVGVSLGKDRASGQNRFMLEHELIGFNRELESIFKAYNMGWNKENIGSHIVRNNEIFDCEQAGVVGHLGGVFSTVENNYIHDINAKGQYTGAEVGCIKLHAAIDVIIKDNYLDNGVRGLWLDWQAIGTRVTGNVFVNNSYCDIMIEVSHGPCLVDNNVMLSRLAFLDLSQGSAFVHNIIAGNISSRPVGNRYTPYHVAHSTDIAGVMSFPGGDDRFYNNIFIGGGRGLSVYDEHPPFYPGIYKDMNTLKVDEKMPEPFASKLKSGSLPAGSNQGNNFWLAMHVGGNVYYNGTAPYKYETSGVQGGNIPAPEIIHRSDAIVMKFTVDSSVDKASTVLVDTDLLDKAYYSEGYYENPDGTSLTINTDYNGQKRNLSKPKAGPFEDLKAGENEIILWKF